MKSFTEFRSQIQQDVEEGYVPTERNRPDVSADDKAKLGKVADLMAKEKAKKDLPFTPDKPRNPVATAGKYGSGYSTARHLARQGMKDVQKEEVVEEEQIDELSKSTLGSYIKQASQQAVTAGIVGTSMGAGHTPKANQPEPGSKQYALMRKREAGVSKAVDKLTKEETEMSSMEQYLAAISGNADFRSALEEKKLTPAELKKREEIAQAIERENPGMDMSKKMAIATAQAKKVAEEVDLEEAISDADKETMKKRAAMARPELEKTKDVTRKFGGGEKGAKNVEQGFRSAIKRDYKKMDEEIVEEGKEHTVPKTEKEKDLAALAEPKDKITHADVMVGRGVKKEELSSKEKMKRGLYNKEEAELEEAKSCMKEENPTGIKIYHTGKDGKETHGIVFTPHDARTYEKEVKQSGGKVTHRAVMYGKKEGERVAVKEGVEFSEGMISYGDFMDKIAMHRKMGNKVVNDKYSDKHATYTSIDKEGVGRKVTHTTSGQKMENLGKVAGDDDEAAEVKTEKRGRGRPTGTKSGARRHS